MSLETEPERRWRDAMCRAGFASPGQAFHFASLTNPLGDRKAAEQAYKALLAEQPDNREALEGLAYLLQIQGKNSEALQYRHRRLRLHARDLGLPPKDQVDAASYLLSAQTGDAPPQAPASYVEGLFDAYASSFDEHLVGKLAYRVPALLLSEFNEHSSDASASLAVLDIGCGTGLAGQAFRSLACRLDGFDLSRQMLAAAQKRRIYDHLSHGEIVDLLVRSDTHYDLVVGADVLPYLGDLAPLFDAVASVLRELGRFVFSVEKGSAPFRVGATGRYQHSAEYVRSCAARSGFEIVSQKESQLREQHGRPVIGYLTVLRRLATRSEERPAGEGADCR